MHKAYVITKYEILDFNVECEYCHKITTFKKQRLNKTFYECSHCKKGNEIYFPYGKN
jgi:ssDNA-binding Zn-finger/Zn-ribbon topoisomerase 1